MCNYAGALFDDASDGSFYLFRWRYLDLLNVFYDRLVNLLDRCKTSFRKKLPRVFGRAVFPKPVIFSVSEMMLYPDIPMVAITGFRRNVQPAQRKAPVQVPSEINHCFEIRRLLTIWE